MLDVSNLQDNTKDILTKWDLECFGRNHGNVWPRSSQDIGRADHIGWSVSTNRSWIPLVLLFSVTKYLEISR